jgi:hypothetical protein
VADHEAGELQGLLAVAGDGGGGIAGLGLRLLVGISHKLGTSNKPALFVPHRAGGARLASRLLSRSGELLLLLEHTVEDLERLLGREPEALLTPPGAVG